MRRCLTSAGFGVKICNQWLKSFACCLGSAFGAETNTAVLNGTEMPVRGKWQRGRRKATFGKPAQKSDREVGDLVGKIVHIPAEEYGIDVPGMFYRQVN